MFNNKFFLGVTKEGYSFFVPPVPGQILTDAEALELAALIVAMKPALREQFDQILAKIEAGE